MLFCCVELDQRFFRCSGTLKCINVCCLNFKDNTVILQILLVSISVLVVAYNFLCRLTLNCTPEFIAVIRAYHYRCRYLIRALITMRTVLNSQYFPIVKGIRIKLALISLN